jgi:hypothetical protein
MGASPDFGGRLVPQHLAERMGKEAIKDQRGAQGDPARLVTFRHCAGFRVESEDGHVGFVEDVLFGADQERPAALAIRSGLFNHRVQLVSVEAVQEVVPNERKVRLRASVARETRTLVPTASCE